MYDHTYACPSVAPCAIAVPCSEDTISDRIVVLAWIWVWKSQAREIAPQIKGGKEIDEERCPIYSVKSNEGELNDDWHWMKLLNGVVDTISTNNVFRYWFDYNSFFIVNNPKRMDSSSNIVVIKVNIYSLYYSFIPIQVDDSKS